MNMSYDFLHIQAQKFLSSMKLSDTWEYKFSQNNPPSMIASALATMLSSFLGKLKYLSEGEKKMWATYFNSYQQENGFFMDDDIHSNNLMPGYTQERALFHRTCHVLFAITLLGYKPKYHFNFLGDMLKPHALENWMRLQNLKDYWDASNKIMNLALFFTFEAKAHQNRDAENGVHIILDLCDKFTNPKTGYHDAGQSELRNAMAGAMHLYPLYFIWNRKPKFPEKVIDATLSLQNKDGFFAYQIGTCGHDCLDYDAINILTNFYFITDYRKKSIETCMHYLLNSMPLAKNSDGGFCCHRKNEIYKFGTETSNVPPGGSSLWSTYARLVTIAMATKVLINHPAAGNWNLENNFIEIWDGRTGRMKSYVNFTGLKET